MTETKLHNRFLSGVLSTGLGTLVTIIFSLVSIMIAVRHVTKDDMGTYIIILTIVSSIDLVSDFGVNISTIRNLACSNKQERISIVSTIVFYKLSILFVCCLAMLLTAKICNMLDFKYAFINYIYLVMLLLVFESLNALLNAILQGYQKFIDMALAKIILSTSNCMFIVALISLYHLGIISLVMIRVVSLLIVIAYQLWVIRSEIMWSFNKKVWKSIFRFGFPLGLNSILTFVFLRLDTLIIGYFLNPMSVALYGIASKIPDASRQLFDAFRSVYFPNMAELFSQARQRDAESVLNNSLRIISFISILAALIAFLFQKMIVMLLFSKNYLDSAPVLAVLMLVLSIGLIGNIIGTSLVAAGYSRLPVLINVIDTITTVVSNIILIPIFGVIGAGYAALLSRIITNPVNVYFLKKNNINIKVRHYIIPLLIYTICIGLYYVANNDSLYFKVVVICSYLILCTFSKTVNTSDIFYLMNSIFKKPAKGTA